MRHAAKEVVDALARARSAVGLSSVLAQKAPRAECCGAFCAAAGQTCCETGVCQPGYLCCRNRSCVTRDEQCCTDGSHCPAGTHCYSYDTSPDVIFCRPARGPLPSVSTHPGSGTTTTPPGLTTLPSSKPTSTAVASPLVYYITYE